MKFFEFLFKKRALLAVTTVVIIGVAGSVLYQLFIHDSKEKHINNALFDMDIVKYGDAVSGKICETRTDHTFEKYVFCDYESGCYFGHNDLSSNVDVEISSFIILGKTVLVKEENEKTVRFINDQDTLVVTYELYPTNGALYKGVIVK